MNPTIFIGKTVMPYYINLSEISLEAYKQQLLTDPILKSRLLLREDIDEKFAIIESMGISTLADLYDNCRTKARLQKFIETTGLDENYCAVLAREVKTNVPAPVKLKDFPLGDIDCSGALANQGIKDSKQLYEKTRTEAAIAQLSQLCGIPMKTLEIYAQLCDLTRIRYTNHTFAVLVHKAGYHSAQSIAEADAQSMFDSVQLVNEREQLYCTRIGVSDMEYIIHYAGKLSLAED